MLFGYALTGVMAVATIGLLISLFVSRQDIKSVLKKGVTKYSLAVAALTIIFFIIFSILYVHPTEQLYFDENIYQGIALNIMMHGNAEWCQYGTALYSQCFSSVIYHDIVGWPFFIAIAFSIFGIGIQTAYALQLLVGALSILFVFLLTSALFERSDVAAAATVVYGLMPELFVWARTQAIPDLALTMFASLAFFLFVVFVKRQNRRTLAAFSFSAILAAYIRTEGILLFGIFAILYFTFSDYGLKRTIVDRIRLFFKNIDRNTFVLTLILITIVLMIPLIYFFSAQLANPQYGQGSSSQLFSFSNFQGNFRVNMLYLAGADNQISAFPAVFPESATVLAIIGLVYYILSTRQYSRRGILLLLLLWFIAYELFYGFFYAGSALFGVDVRFMLQIMPSISILAGLGIVAISEEVKNIANLTRRNFNRAGNAAGSLLGIAAYAVALILFVIVPFVLLLPNITLTPQQMPQQSVIHAATSFIYNNYQSVPNNCVVFTFTPDVWSELNRSAAQISYLSSGNQTFASDFKNYSCYVIDYGYWCNVPPFQNTTCAAFQTSYHLQPLALENNTQPYQGFGLYRILNYTPG